MPARKKHIWNIIKGAPGTFRCQRCRMFKYVSPGKKTLYVRDGKPDTSATKLNCFILSKD